MGETIEKIIFTLNLLEVHGEANLSRLLGCIQELHKLEEKEGTDHGVCE